MIRIAEAAGQLAVLLGLVCSTAAVGVINSCSVEQFDSRLSKSAVSDYSFCQLVSNRPGSNLPIINKTTLGQIIDVSKMRSEFCGEGDNDAIQ